MAMVNPNLQKLRRLFITHLEYFDFHRGDHVPHCAMIHRPSRALKGTSPPEAIPDKISQNAAAGAGFQRGTCGWSGNAASFPVLWLELGENRRYYRHRHRGALHHLRLRFRTNAFSGKATLLKGMLIFQMFPAVLCLCGGAVCVI